MICNNQREFDNSLKCYQTALVTSQWTVRIRNLNWVLQEKVKSLYVEYQIWRGIDQTNKANPNTLRTNLDQVLAQLETFPTASASPIDSGSAGQLTPFHRSHFHPYKDNKRMRFPSNKEGGLCNSLLSSHYEWC
ncbi:hypothetical protein AT2G12290 [Arabidopsis thaliana]|uniref:At2g12290 n=1 Tax=Arabidopsis thaliana TaxID=3702 RepID=Q9ZUP8_ARATH|nr:uncharacterized protein AT2G12290 [Arabidopsis thaliana]AAC97241.1 hypothetical protein [Arabidopsis thaliana]ABK32175.1 At2g12290 [Arabidopsis thaliana]AEC06195.1 hypothetical protein AT2G12290 [Arabidopsis thaliana]|eukprot:NP_178930.1 hypothetical protein AT2G12290 [Arabidopsis thaliana]